MNYYKQGDAANAEQIKAAFEAKGYHTGSWDYGDELFFFFSMNNGHIRAQRLPASNKDYEACLIDIIKTHPDYQELELSKPHYDIASFKPFDKVLVRDNDKYIWSVELFSFYRNKHSYPFRCTGNAYSQCIPFNEKTKHLLGTTDMPSEEFINW